MQMDWQLQKLPDTAATAYDGGAEANCLDQQLLDFNFGILPLANLSTVANLSTFEFDFAFLDEYNSVAIPLQASSSPPTNFDYDFLWATSHSNIKTRRAIPFQCHPPLTSTTVFPGTPSSRLPPQPQTSIGSTSVILRSCRNARC
jgi:hypothetical protein